MGEKYQSEGHICMMLLLGLPVFVTFEGFVGGTFSVLLNSWASVSVVMYIFGCLRFWIRTITYFYG